MVDLGPFEEPVRFAWREASDLKHEFVRAANILEAQLKARRSDANAAEKDWRGRYAEEFESEHMKITIGDATRFIVEFRLCAKMLEQLANLAREEDDRRQLAREWKEEHDKWEEEQRERSAGEKLLDWGLGDDEPKPPQKPEVKPQPFVASAPPVLNRG